MTGPKGHSCPECGTPKGPDGSPSCGCTQRTSEALRDARTAEAAAVEDFDPLRIRPYVDLDAPAAATMPPRPPGPVPEPAGGPLGPTPADAETVLLLPVEPVRPEDRLGGPEGPDAADGEKPGRRRRVLLATAAVLTGVVAAAGAASGLFSHIVPERDGAEPRDVRASIPDVPPGSPTPSASAAAAVPVRTSTPVGASAAASPSSTAASSSPSAPAGSTPSAGSSGSAEPTQSASLADTPASPTPTSAQVLRRGDHGAEVTELQLRLHQTGLYLGDDDGEYDGQVENAVRAYQWSRDIQTDDPGVYGPATRAELESETSEP